MPLVRNTVILNSVASQVSATCFNQARRFLRGGNGARAILLPGQRGFEMRLSGDGWLCWDQRLGEPLLGWHSFGVREREGLHLPVACKLDHYHSLGSIVLHTVLVDFETALARQLEHREPRPSGARVLSLAFAPR